MGFFKDNSGIVDVIRCDEQDYLIWKWSPSKNKAEGSKRENSIRFGSSLRVKEGEIAVFVYKQNNDVYQECIIGPFDKSLDTKNLPVIAGIVEKIYGGQSPFQAEIYFINLANTIQLQFAVPYFDVFDFRCPEYSVPIAVRGTLSFRILDFKFFISRHRLIDFSIEDLKKLIRDTLNGSIKNIVANLSMDLKLPVTQFESKITLISEKISSEVSEKLLSLYGISVTNIDVGDIDIDKSSDDYSQLMAITKNITHAAITTQAESDISSFKEKQRIDLENYSESLKIQREECQYVQRKQTQTANLAAFQTEMQANVATAGAEALGKMNSAINNGFSPSNIMTGMIMGQAIGQNVANSMNTIMTSNEMPPIINESSYYVAINGKSEGPYTVPMLKSMLQSGNISLTTLVWKKGMQAWTVITNIEELNLNINDEMPPIPE